MMNSSNHPVWPIIRLGVMLGFLTLILYLTAHQFDQTELKTIIAMFVGGAAAEGLPGLAARFLDKKSKGDC